MHDRSTMRVQRLMFSAIVLLCVFIHHTVDSQGDLKSSLGVIPLIDLEPWNDEGSSQQGHRNAVASQVRNACQDIGFFAIVHHGVNETILQEAFAASRDFFDLSLEEKLKSMSDNTTEYPYGYEHCESLTRGHQASDDTTQDDDDTHHDDSSQPDLKETFSIGPSHPNSGMPPRRFPQHPQNFQSAVEAYYDEMELLATKLLQIFALSLDLDEVWFQDKFHRHQAALRLLNYPSLFEVKPGQVRAGAHTDYGAFTILKSGGPGLQLKFKGEWIDVPYLTDAFVINIGDLMQRWTNDKWVSTLHRVVVPPKNDEKRNDRRMSMAFFVNMNGDAQIEPIATCVDDDNPSKYQPITAGAHLMAKHLASMGRDEL